MTERLYYDQTYLREFDAQIIDTRQNNGESWVLLDRSAFYPTSGGQPYDTGTLCCGDITSRVTDVEVEDGLIWHKTEKLLPAGASVHGVIDWVRRFDHMQQHGGEHMLAGAVWRLLGGVTIGLHLSTETSSIDADLPGGRTHLTEAELNALEEDVNTEIQRNVPIRCWFPSPEELDVLPLRKPPTVKEHVRVVAIGDKEMVACGGTHPASAGEIGSVKILSALPARGKLRLTFVCGMRAFRYFAELYHVAERASVSLSASPLSLDAAVSDTLSRLSDLHDELHSARRQLALLCAQKAETSAEHIDEKTDLISLVLPPNCSEALRDTASALLRIPGRVVLLAAPAEKNIQFLFARTPEVSLDMGTLLRSCGAKGGGKPDFAQGSASDILPLEKAQKTLLSKGDN